MDPKYREMSEVELLESIKQERLEIFQIRSQALDSNEKKPHLIRSKKKMIAQMMTVLNEKKMIGAKA